jgi:hypothetical protein
LIAWAAAMLLSVSLTGQSRSLGNTYVHNQGESVVFGQHDFDYGGTGVLPGLIGTDRHGDRGYFSFSNVSTGWKNVDRDQHVDGYVRYYGSDGFTFPIGNDNFYRPVSITGSAGAAAAYYRADPSTARIQGVFGDLLQPLPAGAPFNRSNKSSSITEISEVEYWDIDGDSPTKITLTWDFDSRVAQLTDNDLDNLTIVGWNGSMWVPIPSSVDVVYLSEDSSTPEFTGGATNQFFGSITTNDNIVPNDYLAYTFGTVGLSIIGDYVWEDLDRDGVQEEGEPPLANVLVELFDSDREYVTSTTSDANGRYFLEGVEPGVYFVKFNSPSGFLTTLPGRGDSNLDSDVTVTEFTPPVRLDVSETEFSIDAGFYTNGSIGDFVWVDDGDGVRQDNEPGLSGVEIELLNTDFELQASTFSGENGNYSFTNLPPDQYILRFLLPEGFDYSPLNAVVDRSIDSDADPLTGMSEVITLNSGEIIEDYDAGFSAPCEYVATIDFTDPNCGAQDGRIGVTIDGMTGPYDYVWSTGDITPTINGLGPGTYDLIITDIEGCPRTFIVELSLQGDCDPVCAQIDASVYIEGSFDVQAGQHRGDLLPLGYLPGQRPRAFFGIATEPGHPYNTEPWFYNGTEGLFIDETKDGNSNSYSTDAVDWVLVSLRLDRSEEYESCTRAGILKKDGTIEFTGTESCCVLDPSLEYYVVVEHRNHLIVMSPEPVPVIDGKVVWDFRDQQSYRELFGFGQKEISPGVFVMYGANSSQALGDGSTVNITVDDLDQLQGENGQNSSYYLGDFNLNGDVNVQDVGFYLKNIGVFSDVPKG